MRRSTSGIVAAIVVGATVAPFLTPYYSGLALTAIAFAILGLSVNLVYGYLGFLSFGHAAFFGLAAYTAGLLHVKADWPFALCALVALVPPTLLGALIGFASLRVSGAYFAIATLASAEVLRLVAVSWVSMTRGPLGTVVPAPGFDALENAGVALYQYHLVIAVLVLGAIVLLLRRLLRSPVGRSWLAIRESLDLAESVGVPTLRIKVVNIALSGALAGVAGVLMVPKVLVLSPDLFGASYSAIALLIVILGGRGTLTGALVGGVVFAVLPEMLRAIDEYRMVVFAALLLVVVRVQSDGLMGWILKAVHRRDAPLARAVALDADVKAVAPAPPKPRADDVTLLKVRGLQKHYAGVRAVDGSDFTVRAGEIFGIIGPNGAGKTTLLKLVSGFEPATAGSIESLGRDSRGLAPHALARLGVVRTFQHTELYRNLTVLDNVMIGTWLVDTESTLACMLQGRRFRDAEGRRRAIAEDALRRVGLAGEHARRADELPYGEQKLLSIALALAAGPTLLLLDEPAAGLNHSEADRLRETLKALRDDGLTIVVVDHNLQLMMSTCDRLLAVDHGVPLIEGTPAEVAADPAVREAYLADVLLDLAGLGVRYGKTVAVDGVDVHVRAGEIVALVGANGAGKSSLLKAVLGVAGTVSGTLRFGADALDGLAPHARVAAGIALVPEGRHVFPRLSVRENLELGFARGTPDEMPARMQRMYALFPILESRASQAAGTLSGGEQQMLVIGRALMSAPRLLMLDEPTLGLAPLIVKGLGELLAKLRGEGQTILLAEQNARMSLGVSDRAYVLAQGRVLREGASEALRDSDEIRKAYLGP